MSEATTACSACGHQVAKTAKTCPSCGKAWPGLSEGQQWTSAIIVTAIAIVLLVPFAYLAWLLLDFLSIFS